jgi:uncharacterized integral membrane protein
VNTPSAHVRATVNRRKIVVSQFGPPDARSPVTNLPLLPEQPTTTDQVRRFGPTVLLAIIGLLFVVQNTKSVTFNFLWFDFRWPLWIMLIVFMSISGAAAYGIGRRIRTRESQAAQRSE